MSDKDYLIKGEMYQYNLGWLIKELMSFKQDLATAIDLKTIKYADPIQWDITTQYPANTVVVDPKSGTAYMSKVPVPAGVELTNTSYWVVVFNYQDIYNKIMDGVAFNDRDQDYATKDLLVNDLVWYAGDLYRVTRAIPVGSKYIPGANLIKTTIESMLARYYGRDRTAQISNDTVNVSGDYTLIAGDIAETANNITLHSTKDMLFDSDGKLTEQIAGNREIDVDGNDSVHVDGVTSINRGGSVTEVYGSSVDKKVTGASTEKYEDTVTRTMQSKTIINGKDVEITADVIVTPLTSRGVPFVLKGAYKSVYDFGAVGDGVTDDTAAIQEAINHGGCIVFPYGSFVITNTIKLNSNLTLLGYGCQLIQKASSHMFLAWSNNITDVFKNITIAGFDIRADANTGIIIGIGQSDSVSALNSDNINLLDLTIHDTPSRPIDILYGSAETFRKHPIGHVTIKNCNIFNIGAIGITCSGASVTIDNCQITNTALESITVDNGCQNVIITNSILKSAKNGYGAIGSGIEADNVTISNNIIYCSDTLPGVSIGGGSGDYLGCIITSNLFIGGGYALHAEPGTNLSVTICGNHFLNQTKGTIDINGSPAGCYITFTGNEITQPKNDNLLKMLKYVTNHDLHFTVDLTSYYKDGFAPTENRNTAYIDGNTLTCSLSFTPSARASGDIPITLPDLKSVQNVDSYINNNLTIILRSNGDIQFYGTEYTAGSGLVTQTVVFPYN